MSFWQLARLRTPPNRKPRTKPRVAGPEAAPVYHPLYRALVQSCPGFPTLAPFLTEAFYRRNWFTVNSSLELDAFITLIGPSHTHQLRDLQLTPAFFEGTGLAPPAMTHPGNAKQKPIGPAMMLLDDAWPFFAGVAARLFHTPRGHDTRAFPEAPSIFPALFARRALTLTQLAVLPKLRTLVLTYAGEVRMVVPKSSDDRGTANHPWPELKDLTPPDVQKQFRALLNLAWICELGSAIPTLEEIGFRLPVGRSCDRNMGTDKCWVVVWAVRSCTHKKHAGKVSMKPNRVLVRLEEADKCLGGWCQLHVAPDTQWVTRRELLAKKRHLNLRPGCEHRRYRNDWASSSLEKAESLL